MPRIDREAGPATAVAAVPAALALLLSRPGVAAALGVLSVAVAAVLREPAGQAGRVVAGESVIAHRGAGVRA